MSQDETSAGAGVPRDLDALRQELGELRERMSAIKEEAAAQVHDKWSVAHRTQELFDLKVNARLAAHQEYRSLRDRVRDTEAALAKGPGAAVDAAVDTAAQDD